MRMPAVVPRPSSPLVPAAARSRPSGSFERSDPPKEAPAAQKPAPIAPAPAASAQPDIDEGWDIDVSQGEQNDEADDTTASLNGRATAGADAAPAEAASIATEAEASAEEAEASAEEAAPAAEEQPAPSSDALGPEPPTRLYQGPAASAPAVAEVATTSSDTERNALFSDTLIDAEIEGKFGPPADDVEAESPFGDTVVDPPRDTATAGVPLAPRGAFVASAVTLPMAQAVPVEREVPKASASAPSAPLAAPAAPLEAPPRTETPESLTDAYKSGQIIAGKYRLTRVIGRGGMGAVWLAHNMTLDIDVAIKLIRRDRAAPEASARLLTEARAAARLGHPSIVRVFDFGQTSSGDPFIVMEMLHGESLAAVLARKRRLTVEVAVRSLLPVMSALVEAHDKGVVHRDLKPDNILLATDERGRLVPKIVDFGIAKMLQSDVDRGFTLAGEVLGSPDYMSPEQAKGDGVLGAPTDVWALSVVFYELITGRRPFEGPNYNALILAIITTTERPLTDFGVDDPVIATIVRKGLAKEVRDRWPSMLDMGRAFASWAVDHGIDEDVTGTPIGPNWLTPARRALSVYPPSGMGIPASHPPPAAEVPFQAPSAYRPPAPAVETMIRPQFRPNRTPWIVGAMLVLGSIIAAIVLLGEGEPSNDPSAAEAASAAPPGTGAAPLKSATSAAASDPDEDSAAANASAAPAASEKTPRTLVPKKPTGGGRPAAPPVPKNISF